MEITGLQTIPAPPQAVWDALTDPAVLKKCLPGCEKVESASPDVFDVVMAAAVGPLRARFNGRLRLTETNPPHACVMVFEGQGGAIGFGKGTSSVTLKAIDAGTELSYSAQAQVGGKLAQVGSRLIDGVARKMSDDFFDALRRQFTNDAPQTVAREPGASPAAPSATPTPASAAPERTDRQPAMALIPAWWLIVAAVLGSAATLAGGILLR